MDRMRRISRQEQSILFHTSASPPFASPDRSNSIRLDVTSTAQKRERDNPRDRWFPVVLSPFALSIPGLFRCTTTNRSLSLFLSNRFRAKTAKRCTSKGARVYDARTHKNRTIMEPGVLSRCRLFGTTMYAARNVSPTPRGHRC